MLHMLKRRSVAVLGLSLLVVVACFFAATRAEERVLIAPGPTTTVLVVELAP